MQKIETEPILEKLSKSQLKEETQERVNHSEIFPFKSPKMGSKYDQDQVNQQPPNLLNHNIDKFNKKVRMANSKIGKRKRSKGRKISKSLTRKEKEKANSRNCSLSRLKHRIPKMSFHSHYKTKDNTEKKEENYDPKKRGIGMEFLAYVKKKPSSKTNKVVFSTHKTTSDWGISTHNGRATEMKKYKD